MRKGPRMGTVIKYKKNRRRRRMIKSLCLVCFISYCYTPSTMSVPLNSDRCINTRLHRQIPSLPCHLSQNNPPISITLPFPPTPQTRRTIAFINVDRAKNIAVAETHATPPRFRSVETTCVFVESKDVVIRTADTCVCDI